MGEDFITAKIIKFWNEYKKNNIIKKDKVYYVTENGRIMEFNNAKEVVNTNFDSFGLVFKMIVC